MRVETNENLEMELQKLLEEQSDSFLEFLNAIEADYSRLNDPVYYDFLISEFEKYKTESKTKRNNRLEILRTKLINDLTGQFGEVLNPGEEQRKWGMLLLFLMFEFEEIFGSEITTVYENTPERVIGIIKNRQEKDDEIWSEVFEEKVERDIDNSNNFNSVNIVGNFLSSSVLLISDRINIRTFTWETMQDGRVRDRPDMNHVERQGQTFDMQGRCLTAQLQDDREILPKQDPYCRCWFNINDLEIRKGVLNASV